MKIIDTIKEKLSSHKAKRNVILIVIGTFCLYNASPLILKKLSNKNASSHTQSFVQDYKQKDHSNLIKAPRREEAVNKHILNKVDYIDNEVIGLKEQQDIKAVNELKAKLEQAIEDNKREKAEQAEVMNTMRVQMGEMANNLIESISTQRETRVNNPENNYILEEGIKVTSFNLPPQKRNQPVKLTKTIPAHTIAEGVVIMGAWAANGVHSATNPEPILIRISSNGIAPGDENVNVKDCTVSASLHGDLSSRRAIARLDDLVCATGDGREIVTQVMGTVSGAEGKAGIRGDVTLENQEYIVNTLLGGTLSGVAQAAATNNSARVINPFTFQEGDISEKTNFSQKLGNAFAGSASNSIDGVGQMYTEIAKQITPITAIDVGQKVNVIFLHTAYRGNKIVKKEIANEKN